MALLFHANAFTDHSSPRQRAESIVRPYRDIVQGLSSRSFPKRATCREDQDGWTGQHHWTIERYFLYFPAIDDCHGFLTGSGYPSWASVRRDQCYSECFVERY